MTYTLADFRIFREEYGQPPSCDELRAVLLDTTDHVKLFFDFGRGTPSESMWVAITQVCEDGTFMGSLRNHPQNPALKYGDLIPFEWRHIMKISVDD